MNKQKRAQLKHVSELQLRDFVVVQWKEDPEWYVVCFVQGVVKKNDATLYTLYSFEKNTWKLFAEFSDKVKGTYNLYTPSLEELRTVMQSTAILPFVSPVLGELFGLAERYVGQARQVVKTIIEQYPNEKFCDIHQHVEHFVKELFLTEDLINVFSVLALQAGENPNTVLSAIVEAFEDETEHARDLTDVRKRQMQLDQNKAKLQQQVLTLEQSVAVVDVENPLYNELHHLLKKAQECIPKKLHTDAQSAEE